jgi:RNA polymerase sigma-70 factor (ECF subfamily)
MAVSRPARRGAPQTAASDEARLVEAAREKDEAAWSSIFDDHFQSLYRYAYYRTGDGSAAEEIAAQVFEEALRGIKRFEYRGISIKAWLFAIARNLIASHLATRARLKQTTLVDTIPVSYAFTGSDDQDEALAALRDLPDEQQQVVGMTLLENLSSRDCAEVMGRTVREVNSLQLKALRQLRATVSTRRAAR